MTGPVGRVAFYRFVTTFGRRWGGYLSLVVLIGLIGGVAMGSLAAARRTQSSFATFLASTDPSDLTLADVYGRNLTGSLGRLPGVQHVESVQTSLNAFPLTSAGTAIIPPAFISGEVAPIGSLDGEYFDQDRVTVTAGRMAIADRADEFVATVPAARLLGWHVGQAIAFGFYTNAQAPTAKPQVRLEMHLVGTVVFNNEVVLDDVDRFPTYLLFTPALTRQFSAGPQYLSYGLKLRDGALGTANVEHEIIRALRRGTSYSFHVTSVVQEQVDRAVKPEAIALGVFGGVAMLAALLISLQLVARQLQEREADTAVLRALGGSQAVVMADGLFGILGAAILGSLVATATAIGLSPLGPLGPVRPVYPDRGLAVDATVLGSGLMVLVVGIGSAAVVLAARSAWAVRTGGRRARGTAGSGLARLATRLGAPVSVVIGARFTLEPGRGRTAVPVRSAMFGNVLAVAIVVATLTFGSGLATLVSHPSLYGWNWSYALVGYPVPPQSLSLLNHDRLVAAWSGVSFADVQVDGLTVPVILAATRAPVSPPVLSGHALDAKDEIVLGAATLAQLHKRVGDTVVATYGVPADAPVYVPPTRLVIAGTATLPAIGSAQTLHTSMGTGAVIATGIEPPAMARFLRYPDPTLNGPTAVFVRLRSGVGATKGLASLQRVANIGTKAFEDLPANLYNGQNVEVLPAQYPAEIENYRSIGATPGFLAGGLALGATGAFGLTLIASVRRRRRDLALLKALGFSQRQVAACVAWQSTIAAVVGVAAGIPFGIALGRWLWDLFAHEIYALPNATVPVMSVLYVGIGALVLANLVAALPGRYASRTPIALVLRAE